MKSWEGTGLLEAILDAVGTKENKNLEVSFSTSLGRQVSLDFNLLPFAEEGQNYLLVVIYDITERKQVEEELNKYLDHLEALVTERTLNLKKKAIHLEEALNFLRRQREKDKKDIEENVLYKIDKLVFPYLYKLKERKLDHDEYVYINIIESNLKEINSHLSPSFIGQFSKLTPTEIQIANMIRVGLATKEIAQILKLSPPTIATHRRNIRKKLSLTNKKVNLQTILTTIH